MTKEMFSKLVALFEFCVVSVVLIGCIPRYPELSKNIFQIIFILLLFTILINSIFLYLERNINNINFEYHSYFLGFIGLQSLLGLELAIKNSNTVLSFIVATIFIIASVFAYFSYFKFSKRK